MNLAYLTAKEYQHIVRIVGNDIPGAKKIIVGLTQIRGIGYNFAHAIIDTLKISSNDNIGNLTESQVQSIENIIKNPNSAKFPSWFLNRRKDLETGQTMHMITSDIGLTVRNDIEREKGIYSWRGYRHMYGLKVRGQCTRTSGRKGGAVGVQKGGKVLPAGAPGAPGAETAAPAEGTAPVEGTAPAAGKGTAPAAGKGTAPAAGKGTAPAAGKGTAPAAGKEPAKDSKGGAKK